MKITRWIVEMERKVFSVVLSSVENHENRQKQRRRSCRSRWIKKINKNEGELEWIMLFCISIHAWGWHAQVKLKVRVDGCKKEGFIFDPLTPVDFHDLLDKCAHKLSIFGYLLFSNLLALEAVPLEENMEQSSNVWIVIIFSWAEDSYFQVRLS